MRCYPTCRHKWNTESCEYVAWQETDISLADLFLSKLPLYNVFSLFQWHAITPFLSSKFVSWAVFSLSSVGYFMTLSVLRLLLNYRKSSWHKWGTIPSICLERLRKMTTQFSRDGSCLHQDLNIARAVSLQFTVRLHTKTDTRKGNVKFHSENKDTSTEPSSWNCRVFSLDSEHIINGLCLHKHFLITYTRLILPNPSQNNLNSSKQ
jgi:hypothetical protein